MVEPFLGPFLKNFFNKHAAALCQENKEDPHDPPRNPKAKLK